MGQAYQLETSTDRYLLEDGSGVYLLELQDVSIALTGQAITSGHGRLRADWKITAEAGQPLVLASVPLVGHALTGQQGTVTPESTTPDVTEALVGQACVSAMGNLGPFLDVGPTGLSLAAASGILTAEGGEVVVEPVPDSDLFDLQRRRHFGRSSTPLARQPYPRRVR